MRTDDLIHQIVRLMEERENRLLVQREQAARQTSRLSRSIIIIGTVLAFGFVGVAPFLIARDFAGTQRANAALRGAKEHLEQRVQERTVDLEQTNAQLRQSREQYAVTLASIGDGVITTDARCRVSFMNGEAERLTGRSRAEAVDKPCAGGGPAEGRETWHPRNHP
jgi:PAS domain-containing protein